MGKDYYDILNVRKNVTSWEIDRAFAKFVERLQLHLRTLSLEEEAKFKEVCEAFEVLANNQRRRIYDEHGEEVLKNGMDGICLPYTYHGDTKATVERKYGTIGSYKYICYLAGDFGLDSSILELSPPRSKFSGTPDTPPLQCDPIEVNLDFDLSTMVLGSAKLVKVARTVFKEGKSASEVKTFLIELHPGWRPGKKFMFYQQGDQHPDKLPGNVIVTANVKPHMLLTIDGDDLRYTIRISLLTALCGTAISAPLLEGDYKIFHLQNEILYPGLERCISNQGLPFEEDPTRRGDLIVTVAVDFPLTLHPKIKEELRRILR